MDRPEVEPKKKEHTPAKTVEKKPENIEDRIAAKEQEDTSLWLTEQFEDMESE